MANTRVALLDKRTQAILDTLAALLVQEVGSPEADRLRRELEMLLELGDDHGQTAPGLSVL